MISIHKINAGVGFRLVLTPNCSMSWRQVLIFYLCTCSLAVIIGLLFTLQGQWLVLPFTGLEMLALGIGLFVTSRKVRCREIITVDDEQVVIEKGCYKPEARWDFKRCWIRLQDEFRADNRAGRRLALGSHGRYVEVGNFLNEIEKDQLAFQLKGCIISR